MRRVRLSSRNGCFFCMPPAGEPCAPLFDASGAILGRSLGTILALSGASVAAVINDPLDGSSRLDLGERPLDLLSIPSPLLIGRRLRLGAGKPVENTQRRQREQISNRVDQAPEWTPQRALSHGHPACQVVPASPRRRRGGRSRPASAPVRSVQCAPAATVCDWSGAKTLQWKRGLPRAHGCP